MKTIVSTALAVATLLASSAARADDATCIAASEEALTLRQGGKLHDALERLALCADAACPAEVKEECARRITAVDAVMPTLILAAKDGAGGDLSAVTVTMDGAPLVSTLDGRALSVDPGEHTFRFETRGQLPIERKLVLRESDKERRELVTIGAPVAPAVVRGGSWGTQKTLAVISGGLGLVGIALGATFGAFAVSSQDQQHVDCGPSACPHYLQSLTDYDYAQRNATASTISFVAGGVLAAAGVVLWFTAPRVRIVPVAAANGAGVTLAWVF